LAHSAAMKHSFEFSVIPKMRCRGQPVSTEQRQCPVTEHLLRKLETV